MAKLIQEGALPPFVYTYPPRSAYRQLDRGYSLSEIWQADERHSLTNELNIYVHIPFCRYICGFCNLYTYRSVDKALYDEYVRAICRHLEDSRPVLESRIVKTVYIGGGTPMLVGEENIRAIFSTLDRIQPVWRSSAVEVCIEATPDSIADLRDRKRSIRGLLESGINRVNLGVQSFDIDELKVAGRGLAAPRVVREAIGLIKDAGLQNLSTDLIMGFNGQTAESWRRSVSELLVLKPETISTYFLTVRPDAWFSRSSEYSFERQPHLYNQYDVAREMILAEGYVQESNVRYKLPLTGGYVQKVLQFRGVPVLGLGVGARSYNQTLDYCLGSEHQSRRDAIREYITAGLAGNVSATSGITFNDEERIRKRLVLDLFDLDLRELQRYGVERFEWIYGEIVAAAVELGLVEKVE
ncbi:MAG: radical SAM protein [Blastocatellia bacterium]